MSDLINFNPLPRKEGDSFLSFLSIVRFNFNPLPRKEGDIVMFHTQLHQVNFNPLPRKEGDGKTLFYYVLIGKFQSTPS